jgi:hypothetical protein
MFVSLVRFVVNLRALTRGLAKTAEGGQVAL